MCTWLNSRCETSPAVWSYDAKCKWCRESERVNLVTSLHCLLVNVRGVYLALIHVTMLNLLWQLFWESLYISMRSRTTAAVYICAIFLFFSYVTHAFIVTIKACKMWKPENERSCLPTADTRLQLRASSAWPSSPHETEGRFGYLRRDVEMAEKWKGLIHQAACTVTGTHTFMLFHNRRGCRPYKKWSCSIWILVFQIHTLGSFCQFWGLMWEHRGWKWVLCVDCCDVFVMILH